MKNKEYTITVIEDNDGMHYVYYGLYSNVYHFLNNSDYSLFTIIDEKQFDSKKDMEKVLKVTMKDFTGDDLLEDAVFYECDDYVESNNIDTSQEMVKIYDYDKGVYSLLQEWFHAKDETAHRLCKDDKGYYIVTGELSLFNPNKLYLTEKDAKLYHNKQYLNFKLSKMMEDKSNWRLKEIVTQDVFKARCNFLNRLNEIM